MYYYAYDYAYTYDIMLTIMLTIVYMFVHSFYDIMYVIMHNMGIMIGFLLCIQGIILRISVGIKEGIIRDCCLASQGEMRSWPQMARLQGA